MDADGMCVGDGNVMEAVMDVLVRIHIHTSYFANWQLATGDDKNAFISNTNIIVNSRFVIN